MNNKIATFKTALQAEHIKKKGTGFYYNSIVFGLISPLLYFIVSIIQSNENLEPKMPFNHLLNFTNESLIPFANFFFPLMIIIMVSRITQLDHKNGGWQLMETQPVSKFAIYFSKFTIYYHQSKMKSSIKLIAFALIPYWNRVLPFGWTNWSAAEMKSIFVIWYYWMGMFWSYALWYFK